MNGADRPLVAPAADRNKEPILAALRRILPERGLVLEIASGTGQHVVHFAEELPHLTWQPSDPDPELLGSIRAWTARAGLANIRPPLPLDVLTQPWPIDLADAVVCINMIHIAPWSATPALMAGAARILPKLGVLALYGPFRRAGRPTAPSNEAFDRSLRAGNPDWGVRDLEAVIEAAARHGFAAQGIVEMPANNLILVFRLGSGTAGMSDAGP